ncbi:hypothetical protein [Mycobacterium avium]|uniref:Uncharacterized protein n=1 Tax=Mycobacterium avium subsp. hominissuis TaxID=439334 RepID=A0A3B6XFG5_MYCAV|nr:hypothetical protein [Mycobacterium avium]PBA55982.1 hypothetical protein CKJ57_15570 [Mycobacterium intracellulare subsp. chimaera]ATO65204.1 hypothetical protein BEP52_11735 [Mycobacterium avium subsp. hominissuis]ATO72441.1 hypothetical protein BJP74_14110 [Mycobacterium avium subsp. hominissuis]AXO25603.1 hypothetical protein DFS55_11385 [Mycobacterium avium subsp. hominissuis]MCA4731506.1 hypothetical protein [Mycobacterium avium subsp. hominissuis]
MAVGAAAWLAMWGVLIGAHSIMGHSQSSVAHPAHALVASLGGEFTVDVDHPHVSKGSAGGHHEQFTTAVLPRSGAVVAALIALGVVAAVALTGGLAWCGLPAGRGPPHTPAFSVTGQDVLTRFCLSRR